MMLLLWRGEDALLAASDALVCVQSFKQKFRRRNYKFRLVLRLYINCSEFFGETLNMFESIEQLAGRGCVRELQLASQIEPLRDLLHVPVFKVLVEGFGNCEAN